MSTIGLEQYHDYVCQEIGLPPQCSALMGTAANMNCASTVVCGTEELTVTAIVTAGVQGNAACAGDPTIWRESNHGWERSAAHAGTINTILLLNRPLTEGALANAAVSMTEAKAAALQQLCVRSLYSQEFATGTTTDQYCIAALSIEGPMFTSASTGVLLGELIASAVRDATLEALRWQNGLEPSYTRSLFHALGRFGLTENSFIESIASRLNGTQLELLKANQKAAIHEPLVAAAAYAVAAVLDRLRYGTLPPGVAREALRQQCAMLAANLAAQPGRWSEFYAQITDVDVEQPAQCVILALALGWAAKWS